MKLNFEATESFQLKPWSRNGIDQFHQNGEVTRDLIHDVDNEMELQIRITLEKAHLSNRTNEDPLAGKCSLLYKHDDDMLQELFATEFVQILRENFEVVWFGSHTIDLRCIPVGRPRRFMRWIQGAVPISEIRPGSILDGNKKDLGRPSITNGTIDQNSQSKEDPMSSVTKTGLAKYESLWRIDKGTKSP